jgi:hypothetical protein
LKTTAKKMQDEKLSESNDVSCGAEFEVSVKFFAGISKAKIELATQIHDHVQGCTEKIPKSVLVPLNRDKFGGKLRNGSLFGRGKFLTKHGEDFDKDTLATDQCSTQNILSSLLHLDISV